MDMGIEGRGALVLAGGGGLGRAIALALAGEGAHVAVAGVRAETIAETVAEIEARGGKAYACVWDMAQWSALPALLPAIEAAVGPIDILINNSGGPPPATAAELSFPVLQAQFEATVLSIMSATQAVLPGMRARGWGRIVTSTSSGQIAPIANLAISNTFRAALAGWSKTLAREVAPDGVTVNLLVPGRIATNRVRTLDGARAAREGKPVAEVVQDSVGTIPVGRYGAPEEYADAALFLASARASYITGATLRVDGGMISSH